MDLVRTLCNEHPDLKHLKQVLIEIHDIGIADEEIIRDLIKQGDYQTLRCIHPREDEISNLSSGLQYFMEREFYRMANDKTINIDDKKEYLLWIIECLKTKEIFREIAVTVVKTGSISLFDLLLDNYQYEICYKVLPYQSKRFVRSFVTKAPIIYCSYVLYIMVSKIESDFRAIRDFGHVWRGKTFEKDKLRNINRLCKILFWMKTRRERYQTESKQIFYFGNYYNLSNEVKEILEKEGWGILWEHDVD